MNKPTNWLTVSVGGPLVAVTFLFGCDRDANHDVQAELEQAIRRAETKADHHALAAYYYKEARLFQRDATWHERIAKVYGISSFSKVREGAMRRYDAMARKSREIAEENSVLARIHRQLADEAPE
ncbi:MAG: hypothetical protein ACREV1_00460 [Gammaproteobacteria bacterium]